MTICDYAGPVFDAVGNLTNISYSDGNPTISLAYDADKRLTNMIDGIGTSGYTYDAIGQLLSEGGLWPDDTVSYAYTNRLRASMSIQQPDADFWKQSYAYDGARRLTSTVSPAGTFGYGYDSTCQLLVGNVALPNGSNITNSYDGNARLLSTELVNSSASVLNSHSYSYNVGNQRTQQTFTAANYDTYSYDKIGQLISATGKEFGGVTNRLLEQLSYGYDAAHNLSKRTNNALVEYFNVNNLNELSSITRYLDSTKGTWLSRDPYLESAFYEVNGAHLPSVDRGIDANEYEFAANSPVDDVDYLGGNAFCKCDYTPPTLPVQLGPTINNKGQVTIVSESQMGTYTCTLVNQGATVYATLRVGCTQRKNVPDQCPCVHFWCKVRKVYTCGMGTTKRYRGVPVWIFTSYAIVMGCPL